MKEMCNERGIRIISLVPYSPSSNGIAERFVGVATSGTRAMLRDSGLPPRFRAEAMSTFMYLRNRTPTSDAVSALLRHDTGCESHTYLRMCCARCPTCGDVEKIG